VLDEVAAPILVAAALWHDSFQRLNTFSFSQPNNADPGAGGLSQPPPPSEETNSQLEATPPPAPQAASEMEPEAALAEPAPSESRWRFRFSASHVWIIFWAILLSGLSYYVMSRFVVTAVVVQGKSMLPTLHDGDRYLLNRWALRFRNPQRGDLVVIRDPGHCDFAVKRIVGLPSDSIHFKDGDIYLNGHFLIETYLSKGTRTYSPTRRETLFLVGQNRYFVLGDNRLISEDSRYYGAVRRDQIIGVIEE